MRLWSVPPLLLMLLCALAGVATVRAADDPGGLFLDAYETYQAGAKLEVGGRLDEALQKFRFCVSLLEQIQKKNPDYEPIVVEYRLEKSREAIARVQSIKTPSPAVENVIAPPPRPSPRIAMPSVRFPRLDTSYRIPMTGSGAAAASAPEPRTVFEPVREGVGSGTINALKDEIRGLRATIGDLNQRLLESTAREQSALTEVDRTKVRVVELQAQMAQANQTLGDLQDANARLASEKEGNRRQIENLESELEAARADLEVADEYNGELFTKLEQASKFIEADEKIRAQLLGERKELSASLNEKTAEIAKAGKERLAAIAEADALRKQAGASAKMAEQNESLAKKLGAAEAQLAEFSKDKKAREKIETRLRDEIKSAGQSLAAMKEELKTGQERIAELEKQLADTAHASASATGAIAEENALLKSLVMRQLREQAKRQQARKLVEEEMEKLQIRSGALLERLDALAEAEPVLTPREKKLIKQPVASGAAQSDFALEVVKKTPESDLPPELVARAAEANELAQKRRFAEAKSIYEEIAREAPKSYLAAVNLGIAERQLGNYAQSIAAFKRALELKPEDPFALTNLGTVEYRNGNLSEAVAVLREAATADPQSYLAHYLLGMALHDQQDHDEALAEVRKSLDLKSDYVPAIELARDLRKEITGASRKAAAPHSPQTSPASSD